MWRVTQPQRSMDNLDSLTAAINTLPSDWHEAGPLQNSVIQAIARHCASLRPIAHSVETGAGKSTLLFSVLSEHHEVFATDVGRSLEQVRQSPLFRSGCVEIIEGPTQVTLPQHTFTHPIQVALIDGPHGYPFPDLEYYYLYPHLAQGGLLIVDDTNIPSIKRMVDILKADQMFELIDMVEDTAFFRRTQTETFDPRGDGWWLQGYNDAHYNTLQRLASLKETIPQSLRNAIPQSVKAFVRNRM